ncbi:MAG TPA: GNAT family N-acetyltransferase [Longimicrobium sp.]|nr:GNAT family N-acetyltransferase [Longimicrobium sp.]
MTLDVSARRDADLTPQERALVAEWQADAFGGQTWAARYEWAPAEWRLLLRDGGEPVSHLKIVTRLGSVDGVPVRLAGIGSVMTPTRLCGRGYASELMRRAADFMFGELDVELGMLFCLPRLLPFYRGLGWIEAGTVWIGQPAGRMRWPESAMVLPRPGAAWQDGELDVRGLPW